MEQGIISFQTWFVSRFDILVFSKFWALKLSSYAVSTIALRRIIIFCFRNKKLLELLWKWNASPSTYFFQERNDQEGLWVLWVSHWVVSHESWIIVKTFIKHVHVVERHAKRASTLAPQGTTDHDHKLRTSRLDNDYCGRSICRFIESSTSPLSKQLNN